MRGSFTIGRVAGIEIGIHYTWIFAFLLFAWIFSDGTFPQQYPYWSTATYWIAGIITSVMIFISVLTHELCHSLVARSRGLKVNSIVLFIFGGVSNIETEPDSSGVEFIMAAAGPFSSLVLAGIFAGIAAALNLGGYRDTPVFGVIDVLKTINIYLAIFNIIPGFPLDGGRVLRSILWGATKNLHRATMIAGNIGRAVGWVIILLGIAAIFDRGVWMFNGFLSGVWMVFIGWFLISAADNAMREQSLQQELAGVRVKDVMDRNPECVSPAVSVASVVNDSFIQRGRRALPVCNEKGLMGIVTLVDVKRLPQDRWSDTPVQEVMTRLPQLTTVKEDDDLNGALKTLALNGLNQIPVMNEGKLVGLLSRADVIRYLQTRQELGIKPDRNNRQVTG